jgi:hypothetical protein
MAHTPLMDVPVKAEVGGAIKPVPLSMPHLTVIGSRGEVLSSPIAAPDLHNKNASSTLLNVSVCRTEYRKMKDKIKELEEQHAAISTSYSLLCEDKEVEAKNEDLE